MMMFPSASVDSSIFGRAYIHLLLIVHKSERLNNAKEKKVKSSPETNVKSNQDQAISKLESTFFFRCNFG